MNDRRCPFCGSEDVVAVSEGRRYRGMCKACGAMGDSWPRKKAAITNFVDPPFHQKETQDGAVMPEEDEDETL